MDELLVFGLISVPITILSWRTLFAIKSHGFYRFFGWECIAWLIACNYKYWFSNPFSYLQIISWILLTISGYLVISGVVMLKRIGKPHKNRNDKTLYEFEKTSQLVDTGIYRYIRHPLYSSLIFLACGIFLKNITLALLLVTLLSILFFYLTARFEEKECIKFFGEKYAQYMKRSKMFIPFIF